MYRVYISQPMRGRTDEQILSERRRIAQVVKAELGDDIEIIDSFIQGNSGNNPVECLAESISKLSQADFIYMAYGWGDFRGCRIEHSIAKEYGIQCLYENSNSWIPITLPPTEDGIYLLYQEHPDLDVLSRYDVGRWKDGSWEFRNDIKKLAYMKVPVVDI